jgi:hypothetical protein
MRVRLLRLLVCNRVGGGGHIDFFCFAFLVFYHHDRLRLYVVCIMVINFGWFGRNLLIPSAPGDLLLSTLAVAAVGKQSIAPFAA